MKRQIIEKKIDVKIVISDKIYCHSDCAFLEYEQYDWFICDLFIESDSLKEVENKNLYRCERCKECIDKFGGEK